MDCCPFLQNVVPLPPLCHQTELFFSDLFFMFFLKRFYFAICTMIQQVTSIKTSQVTDSPMIYISSIQHPVQQLFTKGSHTFPQRGWESGEGVLQDPEMPRMRNLFELVRCFFLKRSKKHQRARERENSVGHVLLHVFQEKALQFVLEIDLAGALAKDESIVAEQRRGRVCSVGSGDSRGDCCCEGWRRRCCCCCCCWRRRRRRWMLCWHRLLRLLGGMCCTCCFCGVQWRHAIGHTSCVGADVLVSVDVGMGLYMLRKGRRWRWWRREAMEGRRSHGWPRSRWSPTSTSTRRLLFLFLDRHRWRRRWSNWALLGVAHVAGWRVDGHGHACATAHGSCHVAKGLLLQDLLLLLLGLRPAVLKPNLHLSCGEPQLQAQSVTHALVRQGVQCKLALQQGDLDAK